MACLNLNIAWLTPVAATLLSFGLSTNRVLAQTNYSFQAIYNIESTLVPITQNILRVGTIAESTDAPYGLTYFLNTNYGLNDPSTNTITFNPDPAQFGFKDFPSADGAIFFGLGKDQLYGNITSTTERDFQNLVGTTTGTISITDGSGIFKGATGKFTFLENGTLSPDTTSIKGQAFLSGSFQTVQSIPEPGCIKTLLVLGMIGTGFQLRKHKIFCKSLID